VLHVSAADLVIGAAAGKGDKHHYIPVFLFERMGRAERSFVRIPRPYDVVKPKLVHPDGTGYVRGLYTVPRNEPIVAEFIEKEFFRSPIRRRPRYFGCFELGSPSNGIATIGVLGRASSSR
jgi:hypothetical protein